MHTAVMTYDFLLAPAYCEPDDMHCRVADLIEYARSIRARNEKILIEEDALEKLHDLGSYPCDGLFKSNLTKMHEQIYTAKDISRVVTSILENSESFKYSEDRLWESNYVSINPSFVGFGTERAEQFRKLVEDVAVFNELEGLNYFILHFFKKNSFPRTAVSVELRTVYPPVDKELPYNFNRNIELQSSYRNYLTSVCAQKDVEDNPENIELMKECFYWGLLCELKKRGQSLEGIDPDQFSIGPIFIESLKMNQCLPGQKFWNSCFSSVVAVLIGDNAYEINPFRKTAKSDEQIVFGDYYAYRCHITKSTVGLRLMFWRDSIGAIVFANVGPKHEEHIENPV